MLGLLNIQNYNQINQVYICLYLLASKQIFIRNHSYLYKLQYHILANSHFISNDSFANRFCLKVDIYNLQSIATDVWRSLYLNRGVHCAEINLQVILHLTIAFHT